MKLYSIESGRVLLVDLGVIQAEADRCRETAFFLGLPRECVRDAFSDLSPAARRAATLPLAGRCAQRVAARLSGYFDASLEDGVLRLAAREAIDAGRLAGVGADVGDAVLQAYLDALSPGTESAIAADIALQSALCRLTPLFP